MIISLRGGNGSGKSYVILTILKRYPNEPIKDTVLHPKKISGYKVTIDWLKKPLYIVGPYINESGGCDSMKDYNWIRNTIVDFEKKGHVLFEGSLVSSAYGSVGALSDNYPKGYYKFLYMDTSLQECLERVKARKQGRDDINSYAPDKITKKYKMLLKNLDTTIKRHPDKDIRVIDNTRALPIILGLLSHADSEES